MIELIVVMVCVGIISWKRLKVMKARGAAQS
jgi:hypothetical protein